MTYRALPRIRSGSRPMTAAGTWDMSARQRLSDDLRAGVRFTDSTCRNDRDVPLYNTARLADCNTLNQVKLCYC